MGAIGTFINVGKVDGSEAMPGTVGEFLFWSSGNDTFYTRTTENAWDAIPFDRQGTFVLPPGDWDVNIWLAMEQTGPPTTYICAYVGPNYVGPYPGAPDWPPYSQGTYYLRNVSAWDLSMQFTPIRVNAISPVNMVIDVEVVASSSLPEQMVPYPLWWQVWARRAR